MEPKKRGGKASSFHNDNTKSRIRQVAETGTAHVIQIHKRGRWCTVGKVVRCFPLGLKVFAMAYRSQNTTTTVSIRPDVLAHCRQAGCRFWVVRHDLTGKCYGLPLAAVESSGWLKTSGGRPEWFVSLEKFVQIPWQRWPYIEKMIQLQDCEEPEAQQLFLFEQQLEAATR